MNDSTNPHPAHESMPFGAGVPAEAIEPTRLPPGLAHGPALDVGGGTVTPGNADRHVAASTPPPSFLAAAAMSADATRRGVDASPHGATSALPGSEAATTTGSQPAGAPSFASAAPSASPPPFASASSFATSPAVATAAPFAGASTAPSSPSVQGSTPFATSTSTYASTPPPTSGLPPGSAPPPSTPPPYVAPTPKPRGRWWIGLAHLLFLIPFPFGVCTTAVLWIWRRARDPLMADQGREAINMQLTFWLLIGLLGVSCLGHPLVPFAYVVGAVLCVLAAISAGGGERHRYPWVFRFIA